MSQMSIEEEKVPGDFARLAARGEPEVADQQDAPADDAFVRRAAPRAARRAAQPKPVSDEDLLSGMNDDPEQLAITKAIAQQRQEEFWRGVGGGGQGTSRSAPTGDAQGRMGVAGPRSLDLWQEGDPEPAIPGPVAGNARAAAPRSLAQTIQDRKFEASLYRPAEPEQQARVLGKAGSRSKFLDNASGVLDWAAKGVGLVKEADDTATLYGKDIPDVMEATGEQFGGTREAMDSALAGYSPFQSAVQGVGGWTDAANKALNPIPKVSLGKVGGKDIKLGVGTKEILSAASGAMQIAQFHKNEDADPNATAMPEREAVATGQTEFRRALEARRRAGRLFEKAGGYQDAGGVGMSPAHTEDGRVQKLLLDEKKRANLVAMKKGMRLALRAHDLGKAQEKSGVRSLNEYSMEKTAYLNDKEFVPRKPLGFSDKSDADKWSPKKGMIKDGEVAKAADYIEASKTVHDRYAEQGAVKGQDLPAGLMPGMQDSAKLEALDDGYRDDIEGGRSKQKQVAPARFLGGAGQLFEGTLNSKRMVRDGRYKTAYAAKAAELGVLTGTKTGAAAAQAGLIAATGGVAAPLIAAAEAGKHLAFHAKEQLGVGMQSASEGLEKLIDPTGLAKEQDNRDLYNKHFGLQKPEAAPDVAEAPANDAPGNDAVGANVAPSDISEEKQPAPPHPFFSQAPEPQPMGAPYDEVQQIMSKKHEYFGMNPEEFHAVQAQRGVPVGQVAPEVQPEAQAEQEAEVPQKSAAPTYEEMTADPSARAADVRQRGLIFEPQGSSAVVGRQKRTMARAAKDLVWGGAKKVAKGLWSGLKGIATVPIHAAKWGWKGLKGAGRGLAAAGRGIASLFSRKKAAEPGNKAREALKAMEQHTEKYKDTAVLDRPQLKVDRLKDLDDLGDLSDEEKVRFRDLRQQHAEVYGQRDEFGDEPGRVGGSRQVAKEALMAKPEVKRAEERAALREQLAPGKYTPRMESGELLDVLRGRARADLESQAQPAGDGGGGPGDGGPQGDLLDQINELEGSGAVRPDRVAGSLSSEQPEVTNNRKFKNALVDESDSSGEKMPAEPEKQAQEPGAAPTGGQQGAQEVRAKRQDSFGRRVNEWQAKADAAGMGLIMDPEDPWLQANPFPTDRPKLPHFDEQEDYGLPVDAGGGPAKAMGSQGQKPVSVAKAPSSGQGPVMKQLIGGEWQEQPEEEKGAGPVSQGSRKGSNEAPFQGFWKGTRHHYGPGPDDYFEYDESVFKPKGVAKKEAGAGAQEEPVVAAPAGRPMSTGPLLAPEQAQGIGTLDRGGGAVDVDLGRAMNSTPRLERNARGYWGNPDYDPKTDSPEFARDDLFIEEAKDRAVDAIRAGQRAGADAEAYRAKYASIRKKHAGGFLNPKNWDRTRARREDKLRSQIQHEYPATPAASPQAKPDSAPSTVVSDAVDRGPATASSRHRTAMPVKSALRSRDGQQAARVPAKLMAEAEERAAAAFDKEEKASQPFSAGGEHAGKLDATMRGGALRTSGLDAAKGPLMTGQLLFGATSSSPKVSPEARNQVTEYEKSIGATNAAEGKVRALTGHQVRLDQGSAAMDIPDFTGPMRPYRTPFFNGYWQREQANPQPTAQSTTGKSVRFDASAEQVPDDQRDSGRQFAIKQAEHHHAKQKRRAKIEADIESYKKNMAPSWAAAGEAGAATHRREKRVPFKAAPPVEVLQQKLMEEE